jgi:hypothetical protein
VVLAATDVGEMQYSARIGILINISMSNREQQQNDQSSKYSGNSSSHRRPFKLNLNTQLFSSL